MASTDIKRYRPTSIDVERYQSKLTKIDRIRPYGSNQSNTLTDSTELGQNRLKLAEIDEIVRTQKIDLLSKFVIHQPKLTDRPKTDQSRPKFVQNRPESERN